MSRSSTFTILIGGAFFVACTLKTSTGIEKKRWAKEIAELRRRGGGGGRQYGGKSDALSRAR